MSTTRQAHAAEDDDIQQYLTWALNWDGGTEHVSYANFVEKFDLNNQEHSQQLYSNLIKSTHIKGTRKTKLSNQYSIFLRQHLDQFWSTRLLKLERKKTRVHSATIAARTSRLAQTASVYESSLGFQYHKEDEHNASASDKPESLLESGCTRSSGSIKRSEEIVDSATLTSEQRTPIVDYEEQPDTESSDETNADAPRTAILLSEATSLTGSAAPVLSSPSKRGKAEKPFTKKNRLSLEKRYRALGAKWVLASGTIVEDVLFTTGSDEGCASLSPIHSFMIDLDDVKTKALFSKEDWNEIMSNLPPYENYGDEANEYLDKCMEVASMEDLRKILEKRQRNPECKIIYHCMDQWEEILSSDSSPFPVAAQLGEAWWKDNAWGACRRLATGIKDAFILTGEKTSHDSSERKNQDIATVDRKKVGTKADFLWRTISSPDIDWSAGESATVWDPASMKYRNEGVFKLPRQLHNILVARTFEAGGVDSLRHEYVCGLLTGGPVVQRVQICWGNKGENITRFFRSPERRLLPTVQELGISLMAVHDLLVLRATTLRLCHKYEQSRRELARAAAKSRRRELLLPSVSPTEKKRKFSLLSSSP